MSNQTANKVGAKEFQLPAPAKTQHAGKTLPQHFNRGASESSANVAGFTTGRHRR